MSRQRGHIRKRGNAWYLMVYTGRPCAGGRQYRYKTVRGTKRAAQKELTRMLSELDQGTLPSSDRETLDVYLDRWLATKRSSVSARTDSDYRYLLTKHVRPLFGRRPLAGLRPDHGQAAYDAMTERDLAGRTIHVTHNVLRQPLAQAVRWRLIAVNPADAVVLPRWEKHEMAALSRDQCRRTW